MPSLSPMLINRILSEYADRFVFSRGKAYAHGGHVKKYAPIESAPGTLSIEGTVRGSRTYHTSVTFDVQGETVLSYACSCPYEDFCKHAVVWQVQGAYTRSFRVCSSLRSTLLHMQLPTASLC